MRRGRVEDAPALARYAAACFEAAFGSANDPADMAAYVREAFGPAQQASELADPAFATFLAEIGPALAGYAQLTAGRRDPAVAGARPIELKRFYVGAEWHGRGVAQALMAAVLAEARRLGADVVWLCVWEHNPRARAFYRKAGFDDAGTAPFQLGRDLQTDIVMTRSV
ncbi:MAG TPA: GNAT family N-acetyltransferase [Gemmatimonadales bacterium]